MALRCGVLDEDWGHRTVDRRTCTAVYRRFRPGSSSHQLDLLLAFQFLNAALLAIWLKAATCQEVRFKLLR